MIRLRGLALIVLVVIASGLVAKADAPSRPQVEVLATGLGGPAYVMKATKSGEHVTLLASGQTQGNRGPSGIAVDQTNVYGTSHRTGTLSRIRKP